MVSGRPVVVVVGAGFAGFGCLRALERRLPADAAELVVVHPTDYLLYQPMLPAVAAGVVGPDAIAVPLSRLRRTRLERGHVVGVDLAGRTVTVRGAHGEIRSVAWDRLVLTPGAVTRVLDVPGLAEHARGFKTLAEATYLRDHVLAELESAADTADPIARQAHCTFVVVGAGYAGTEFVAQMQPFVAEVLADRPTLAGLRPHWVLAEHGPAVLGHLGARLSAHATRVLRDRGVDVRLGTSVTAVTAGTVTLSGGVEVPCRTLVWTAGVTAAPLGAHTALPTDRGRIVVDAQLAVPGHPDVFACGDAAAVPDVTRPGELCAQTAQHAERQARVVARNVAASLGRGTSMAYRHRDLGFVVDLGGHEAVADPLHVVLSGLPAKLVTSAYHLYAVPGAANRLRVAGDWLLGGLTGHKHVALGLVPEGASRIAAAEQTSIYPAEGPEPG
ncbi:MAG: NAD(P)/FAD-dependent oxidoreductase [Pseudonocardia sp.]